MRAQPAWARNVPAQEVASKPRLCQPPAILGEACGRQRRSTILTARWFAPGQRVKPPGSCNSRRTCTVTLADVADLGRLVPHDAPHQGVVIETEPLEDVWIDDVLADAPESAVLLVLDQVTDPHNVGAILRSAAAFGAVGIVTQDRHSPPESGALAKAASGALERVPWARVVNLARALEQIGEAGFWRIGLAGDAETDLKDALWAAAGRAGARRGGPRTAPEHARALRCDRPPSDHRFNREPERVERGGRCPLCSEHRLMVRSKKSIKDHVEALAKPRARLRRSARKAWDARAAGQRAGAHNACSGRSSASRSASRRRDRCGPSWKLRSALRPISQASRGQR